MFGLIGALIGWLSYHLGLRTDVADSSGSLHAKLAELRSYMWTNDPRCSTASNNLKYSADTERTRANSTYAKMKEIIVALPGVVRVKFDIKSNAASYYAYATIYVNGVAAGTERTAANTYTTFSEDIPVNDGDRVQLYLKSYDASITAYCRNFRLYFDVSSVNGIVVTD